MVVINRENGLKDEIMFSLRLINLEFSICEQIKKELFNLDNIEIIHPYSDKNDGIVIYDSIDEYSDYSNMIHIINKFKIEKSKINFFISFTTQFDMSGFTVPKKISDLHNNIGGSIDFSIIMYE